MTEKDFELELMEILYDQEKIDAVWTFREAGLLTRNKGLVVRLTDGSEFQLTIVKSN